MRFVRWLDVRHGKRKTRNGRKGERRDFLKTTFHRRLHKPPYSIVQGHSSIQIWLKQVEYLLSFIKNNLGRLCGDKAYLSRKICNLIAKRGGEPFISIKKNIVKVRSKGSKAWKEMLFLYRRSKKLYLKKYHRRSLAETAVSTVKRSFNHSLYSKKRRGQKNEIRLKVLTYNLAIIARLPAQFE